MKKLDRIVTFMDRGTLGSPWEILSGGSRIEHLPKRHRVFSVRKVVYDDSLTPLYTEPRVYETLYDTLEKLKESYRNVDSVVLDLDNQLRVYEPICDNGEN